MRLWSGDITKQLCSIEKLWPKLTSTRFANNPRSLEDRMFLGFNTGRNPDGVMRSRQIRLQCLPLLGLHQCGLELNSNPTLHRPNASWTHALRLSPNMILDVWSIPFQHPWPRIKANRWDGHRRAGERQRTTVNVKKSQFHRWLTWNVVALPIPVCYSIRNKQALSKDNEMILRNIDKVNDGDIVETALAIYMWVRE